MAFWLYFDKCELCMAMAHVKLQFKDIISIVWMDVVKKQSGQTEAVE